MNAGSVYVFARSGTSWVEQTKITASDPADGDRFGASVSISGDMALVGADRADIEAGEDAGSAYVIRLSFAGDLLHRRHLGQRLPGRALRQRNGQRHAPLPASPSWPRASKEQGRRVLLGTNGKQANPWGAALSMRRSPVVRAAAARGFGTSGLRRLLPLDLNAPWCTPAPSPQKNPAPAPSCRLSSGTGTRSARATRRPTSPMRSSSL